MAETAPGTNARTKKLLVGCALGCFLPVVLLISTCVGFNVWLNSPGELLEPQRLLDEEAVGYAEWRLELENPATERFFEVALEAVDRVQQTPDMPPAVEMMMRWNQRRQARELRRLFPANVSWLMYPSAPDEAVRDDDFFDSHLLSLSIQRVGNQFIVGDWILGFVVGRTDDQGSLTYRREKILALNEPREDGSTAPPRYLFLNPKGLFFGTDLNAVKHGVDGLVDEERGEPGELERLFLDLDEKWQFRGAVLNRSGQLRRLAGLFEIEPPAEELLIEGEPGETTLPGGSERERFLAALDQTRYVSFVGGVQEDGAGRLSFSFAGPPELAQSLDAWAQDWAERLTERDLQAQANTVVADGLVIVELDLLDLVGAIESFDPAEFQLD